MVASWKLACAYIYIGHSPSDGKICIDTFTVFFFVRGKERFGTPETVKYYQFVPKEGVGTYPFKNLFPLDFLHKNYTIDRGHLLVLIDCMFSL